MPDMEALDRAMADEDTVARVMSANRVDRVVSWCGWRSPELGGAALGLILATQLVRALPGSAIVRVIVVIPWVCAPLALGVVWKWIFQPSVGALNQILGVRIEWLTDPSLALPAVAFVAIWQNVGYISLFFQAGLTRIPGSIYEAAGPAPSIRAAS